MTRTPTAPLVLLLAVSAFLSAGPRCFGGGGSNAIEIEAPAGNAVIDDPVVTLAATTRRVDPLTVEVILDETDLIAALGLTPPFFDASGTVQTSMGLVDVQSFTYDTTQGDPAPIDLEALGLAAELHGLVVSGDEDGVARLDAVSFRVVGGFVLRGAVFSGGAVAPGGGLRANSLGQPAADAPVGLSGGGSLHPGFVPFSQLLSEGGTP